MKKLLRALAGVYARLFGAACALHYRTFGLKTIHIDVDEMAVAGLDCNTHCEVFGGDQDCTCVFDEDPRIDDPRPEPYYEDGTSPLD